MMILLLYYLKAIFNYSFIFRFSGGASFDEEMDYDDEVDKNGNIDIGEIASQYLSLELF